MRGARAILVTGAVAVAVADCPFGGFVEVVSCPVTVIVTDLSSPGEVLNRATTVVIETPTGYTEVVSPGVTVIVETPVSFSEALSTPHTIGTLLGDFDLDGQVGIADLAALLSNFGTASGAYYPDGDLNGDGAVALADLSLILSAFGTTCP